MALDLCRTFGPGRALGLGRVVGLGRLLRLGGAFLLPVVPVYGWALYLAARRPWHGRARRLLGRLGRALLLLCCRVALSPDCTLDTLPQFLRQHR
jgi:hypothetical protein